MFLQGTLIHQEVTISPPVHAEDQDAALNATIRYDIMSGNTLELFWLDPNNGSLFLRRALDREALGGERFSLTLRASQKDNPARQGTARLEVIVLDINDNAPRFEVEVYNISIVENLPNGFSVLQVAARDPDKVGQCIFGELMKYCKKFLSYYFLKTLQLCINFFEYYAVLI